MDAFLAPLFFYLKNYFDEDKNMIVQLDGLKQDFVKTEEANAQVSVQKQSYMQPNQTVIFEQDQSMGTAYTEKNLTKEGLMEAAKSTDLKNTKDYMIFMSNSMSQEDYQKLKEEGFPIETMDPESAVTIVDKIKVTLAKSGVQISGYTDTLNQEVLDKITGSSSLSGQILDSLQNADVSTSSDMFQEVYTAFQKGKEIKPFSDSTLQYLVENKIEPTIDQLYKAQYTNTSESSKQAKGYYQDSVPGYYSKKAELPQWEQLEKQVEATLQKEGIPVTEETLTQAKWLVEKGLLLNEKNMLSLGQLQSLSIPLGDEALLQSISASIALGKQASTANLLVTENPIETAIRIEQMMLNLEDETLEQAVGDAFKQSKDLTIEIIGKKSFYPEVGTEFGENKEYQKALTQSRLQVAEIQLKMTAEANLSLLKKGFQLETAPLSELITKLKEELEQASEHEVSAPLFRESQELIQSAKSLPIQTLGFMQKEQIPMTLLNIWQEGTNIQKSYEEAGKAYETMMTSERKDLGDSIEKAFQNIEQLLEELNMENTDLNQKAVRILGLNQMEITPQSIASIKDAYLTFERVMRKLTPKVTLELIRQQKNPMELTMDELESSVSKINFEEDTLKYSKFLYQLEQKKEISKEERKEYLEVYRLFRQIEKSQGAEIGTLVQNQEEINLKNLKQVVKNNVGQGMELLISDHMVASLRPRTYQQKLSSELYDRLNPEVLNATTFSKSKEELSLEQLLEAVKEQEVKEVEEEGQEEFQRFHTLKKVSDDVVKTLLSYEMPMHADQLLQAEYFLNHKGENFKSLLKQEKEKIEKKGENFHPLQQAIDDLPEAFTDQDSAQTAYETMISAAKDVIQDGSEEEDVSSQDLKTFIFQYKQVSMAQNFSKEEFYEVPLQIGGELTAIHLKIIHGGEQGVSCSFETEQFGQVRADFKVQEGYLEGLVVANQNEGLLKLSSFQESFALGLKEEGLALKGINFVQSKQLEFPFFSSKEETSLQNEKETADISTRELYQIAKTFLQTIRSY